MKFWSIFFGIFWAGMGILSLCVELPTSVIFGACFLAAMYNFEEVF